MFRWVVYLTSSAIAMVCTQPNPNWTNPPSLRPMPASAPLSIHSSLPSLEVSVSEFEVVVNSVRRAEGRLTSAARAAGGTARPPVFGTWFHRGTAQAFPSSSSPSLPPSASLSLSLFPDKSFKAPSFSQSQITPSFRHQLCSMRCTAHESCEGQSIGLIKLRPSRATRSQTKDAKLL